MAQKMSIRKKLTSAMATVTVALMAASGIALVPAAAQAAEETVSSPTLEWGVKSSFRNYLYNIQPNLFKGKSTLLGSTTQSTVLGKTNLPELKGDFLWSCGTGVADATGASGEVSFGAANGVHFQSHPMTSGGAEVWALDLQFTNPRVVVTSATDGELRMDVVGRKFVGTSSAGAPYTLSDVSMADLVLAPPTISGESVTWKSTSAKLTEAGSEAFGGFYGAGDDLDNVTVTAPTSAAPQCIDTTTKLATSPATTANEGGKVTLNATVSPTGAEGTVAFYNGVDQIGTAQTVSAGKASVSVSNLAAGKRNLSAVYTPSATTYAASSALAPAFTVLAKTSTKLTVSPAKSALKNSKVKLVANVEPATAAGSVQFYNDEKPVGAKTTVKSGRAAINISTLGAGSRKLKAVFTPTDKANAASISSVSTFHVLTKTTTKLTVSPAKTAVKGKKVKLVAKVSPAAAAGSVQFYDGSKKVGKKTTVKSGRAAINVSNLATGSRKLKAVYTPKGNVHAGSTSSVASFKVLAKTTTKLTVSPAKNAVKGKKVKLVAKVSPAAAVGTVQFYDGSKKVGKKTTVKSGRAAINVSTLSVGSHKLKAVYTPKGTKHAGSKSSVVKLTVKKK